MTKPWLIYALGGGWGHLNRALSLGRIAAQKRSVIIICNSPYVQYLFRSRQEQLIIDNCVIYHIPATIDFLNICDRVQKTIASQDCECIIVDTFPRGLGGELADILPELKSLKVLTHRDINPDYIRAKNLPNFVASQFDLVIIPGEIGELPFSNLPQTQSTHPWLIRNPGELPTFAQACALLKIEQHHKNLKIVIVCASGTKEELSLYGCLTVALAETFPHVVVRCLAATCPDPCPLNLWVFHYPGIECLLAADVVVGGAGYNTFYECFALKVPLVAIAFQRQYDRQALRLWKGQHLGIVAKVNHREEAIAAVGNFLELTPTSQPLTFINGAVNAVKIIEQAIAQKSHTFNA